MEKPAHPHRKRKQVFWVVAHTVVFVAILLYIVWGLSYSRTGRDAFKAISNVVIELAGYLPLAYVYVLAILDKSRSIITAWLTKTLTSVITVGILIVLSGYVLDAFQTLQCFGLTGARFDCNYHGIFSFILLAIFATISQPITISIFTISIVASIVEFGARRAE